MLKSMHRGLMSFCHASHWFRLQQGIMHWRCKYFMALSSPQIMTRGKSSPTSTKCISALAFGRISFCLRWLQRTGLLNADCNKRELTSKRTPKGDTSPNLCMPVCIMVPSMAGVQPGGKDSRVFWRTPALVYVRKMLMG